MAEVRGIGLSLFAATALLYAQSDAPAKHDEWLGITETSRGALKRGDLETARKGFQTALEWAHEHSDPRARLSAYELSAVYLGQHLEPEAEQVLKSEIDRSAGASDPIELIPLLTNLVDIEQRQHKLLDLESVQRRILAEWRRAPIPDQVIVARSLSNLAKTLVAQQKYSEAEPLWDEACRILEKELGAGAPATILYRGRLAWTEARLGKFHEADAAYGELLALKNSDPMVREQVQREYAEVLLKQNRNEEAAPLLKEDPNKLQAPRRIGKDVTAPHVIVKRDPAFTENARKARLQGSVLLQVVIDDHGKPGHITVIEPLGAGLDQRAVAAVREWTFQPGTKDGTPVAVQATVEVNFRLL